LIVTGNNIDSYLAGQLCYMWAPIGAAYSMKVGLSIFKPEYANKVIRYYLLSGIPYWIFLFGLPSWSISSDILTDTIETGGLIDIHLLGLVMIMTAIYLVGFLFILSGGFIRMAINSSGLIKRKAFMHAVAYIIFVLVGIIDALLEFSAIIVFFRLLMAVAFLLIYYTFILDNPSSRKEINEKVQVNLKI
jgi:hypothetical protein